VRAEEADEALAQGLLARLAADDVDYTLFFRRLCAAAADPALDAELTSLFPQAPGAFRSWTETWRGRLALEEAAPDARAAAMRRANPALIPRNHRVEEAIEAAVARGDFQPFEILVDVLARPYDDQPEKAHLAEPPGPEQRVYKTFCGT
jgi:serine/tyrosine/threonine adenylyltransferase